MGVNFKKPKLILKFEIFCTRFEFMFAFAP